MNVAYVYKGQLERFSVKNNRCWFIEGFSRNGNEYPWVGRREAQREERALGNKAVFTYEEAEGETK